MQKLSAFGVLLLFCHIGLAAVFGCYVIYALGDSYLSEGFQLLIALGSVAVSWAIVLERRWALLIQLALYPCYFIIFPRASVGSPGDFVDAGTRSAISQAFAFIPLLVEVATTYYLATRVRKPLVLWSKHLQTVILGIEGAFMVVSAIVIICGDFQWSLANWNVK